MSRVGHDTAIGAIDQEIEFFQDGLADQNLIAKDQRIFQRVAPLNLDDDGLGASDNFLATVGKLCGCLMPHANTEFFGKTRGNDSSNRACIDEGASFISS